MKNIQNPTYELKELLRMIGNSLNYNLGRNQEWNMCVSMLEDKSFIQKLSNFNFKKVPEETVRVIRHKL